MRYVGNVEKILVFAILLVIGLILAVAIRAANRVEDDWVNKSTQVSSSGGPNDSTGGNPPGRVEKGQSPKEEMGQSPSGGKALGPKDSNAVAPANPRSPELKKAIDLWNQDRKTDASDSKVGSPEKGVHEKASKSTQNPADKSNSANLVMRSDRSGSSPADGGDPSSKIASPNRTPSTDSSVPPTVDPEMVQLQPVDSESGPWSNTDKLTGDGLDGSGEAPVASDSERSADPSLVREKSAPQAVERIELVVQKGDTLERIARRLYGDPKVLREIQGANQSLLPDVNRVREGMVLMLPRTPTTTDAEGLAGVRRKAGAVVVRDGQVNEKAKLVEDDSRSKERKAESTLSGRRFGRITNLDEHEVQTSDTLMKIAFQHYGTKSAWSQIYAANSDRIVSRDQLKVGQRLRLPVN